ncbi:MAG: hydrogenase expression/formation C-terminal domain-containing protein [Pseudomonadota bacterium]|nr:hydrogenase expression/formation C-terminal domain-containing protein [Pseudomonadota bacterium]
MSETSIPVTQAVKFNIQVGDELTQNVKPLLHEIKHALDNLIETGHSSIIDLRSIPLAPGEEDKILSTLGQGEVLAKLNALGLSEIIETQYAGVWLVTHYNDENTIISRFIEVTTMPEILCSQTEDIMKAYSSLSLDLAENQETN